MTDKDIAREFLLQDRFVNLNAINALENMENAQVLTHGGIENGVIITNYDGDYIFLATENEDFLRDFWDNLPPGEYFFSGVPSHIAEKILRDKKPDWTSPCKSFALLGIHVPVESSHPTESLTPADAAEVDSFYPYRREGSEAALRRCIEALDSACIRINGELAAWCLTHKEDGSMGPLYVKEQYRRMGLGKIVASRLAAKIIAKGGLPYVQIVLGNGESEGLAKGLGGFEYTHDCTWFGLTKRG